MSAKEVLKEILSTSLYLLGVLLVTFLVIKFVGQRTEVIGQSMEPMLYDKDNLIVEKLSYRFGDPERFDIIVFPYEYAEKTYYIKRIIGLPGEKLFIDAKGNIFINGEKLEENYGKEVIKNPGLAATEITIGEDEYFVMGDNRNNSSDSRCADVGLIKRDRILGKAFFKIFPFDHFGKIVHR